MEIRDRTSLNPPTLTCIGTSSTTPLPHTLHQVAVTAEKPSSSSASVR